MEEDLSAYYFDDKEEMIDDIRIPPITEDYVENYPSVVDRFFTRYYYKKLGSSDNTDEYYLVLFHSNRVCLICLPPEHPAFKIGIEKISYNIGNTDRSQNHVRGKGKKGGMILQDDSTLALITCKDNTIYKVPSCIRGKLIEVNERIVENPEILSKEGDGYLAIVLPKPEHCDQIKENLISNSQYLKLMETKRTL